MIGKQNLTWDEFDAACEYLFFSQWTDIKLNYTATPYDRAYCQAYLDGWIYKTVYGSDELWKMSSFEFLNVLKEVSEVLSKTSTVADMVTLQKYMNRTEGPLPKFIGLFSHDEIINAYFEGLGYITNQGVYPASQLYIEFYNPHKRTNAIFVRTYYQKDLQGKPIPVPLAGQKTH